MFSSCLSQLGLLQYNTGDYGGLNNRRLFLTVLGPGKSKIQVPANSLGESSLPDSQMGAFSLCPPRVQGERERKQAV